MPLGFLLMLLVGTIISLLMKDEKPVHPDLITPICHRYLSDDSKNLRYYNVEEALQEVMKDVDNLKLKDVK